MKKLGIIILCIGLASCAPKKPEPVSTQIIDGKSIIVPPEFDIKP